MLRIPEWRQWCVRLFLGCLLVLVEAKHLDSSSSKASSHSHQSRRNMGTDYHSPQLLMANEHRVTNVTTQIGTNAFLPCKVSRYHAPERLRSLTIFPLSISLLPRLVSWPRSPCPGSGCVTTTS